MKRAKPTLVALHLDQMATLLALVMREQHENPNHPDAWLLERTRQALLGGMALADRYATPPEETPT